MHERPGRLHAPSTSVRGALAESAGAGFPLSAVPVQSGPGQAGPGQAGPGRLVADRAAGSVDEFERPSSARVYDYLLGGAAHGAVDRELGERLKRTQPGIVELAQENRAFLRRAVRFLLAAGIDQFLDLGSGVPTMGNVHEVVARSRSSARVAYTDLDSIAVQHGRHVLAGVPTASYSAVDVGDVDAVLTAPGVVELLDLDRPVGLLAFSVLQHVPGDAAGLVAEYLDRLAPGSALALSHFTVDHPQVAADVQLHGRGYARTSPRARDRDAVAALVDSVELVDPGLVWADEWRPDPGRPPGPDDNHGHWAGVGFRR